MLSERDFIARLRKLSSGEATGVVRAIGDDCAVLQPRDGRRLLVTTDTLIESVHFDCAWHPPELLGRKAAAVNLSDIAAMGGEPSWALLSVAAPAAIEQQWLELFLGGFLAVLAEHGTTLVGGDTVRSEQLGFSITLIGQAAPQHILYRAGARPGDLVWVSGWLGDAAAGLDLCRIGGSDQEQWPQLVAAHLDPTPRVALGRMLATSGLVHAMMDLSDGLATDLAHLCTESGVGAEVEADWLPLSPGLQEAAARFHRSPLDYALRGGEDFELLFTSPAAHAHSLPGQVAAAAGLEIHCVGRIVAQSGVFLLRDGDRLDIGYQGYDHFRR